MQVLVKKTYKQLESFCKEGDTLELNSVLYTEDIKICNEIYGGFDKENGKMIGLIGGFKCGVYHIDKSIMDIRVVFPEVIAPKGSFKDYTITNKVGKILSGSSITNAIGYNKINELFKKL